jgi:hypothetical protein
MGCGNGVFLLECLINQRQDVGRCLLSQVGDPTTIDIWHQGWLTTPDLG